MDYDQVKEELTKVIEAKKDIAFIPEYKKLATDEEVLGLLVAQHLDWDGMAIMQVMFNALEDANFHTLNNKLGELVTSYFKDIK